MNFSGVPAAPEDAVFKVSRLYNECQDPKKVSLGVGAYRDDKGKPLVLEAVIQAKVRKRLNGIIADQNFSVKMTLIRLAFKH